MTELEPTAEMVKAAEVLNEGSILVVYRDGTAIRMETVEGEAPFVWRENHWQRMRIR